MRVFLFSVIGWLYAERFFFLNAFIPRTRVVGALRQEPSVSRFIHPFIQAKKALGHCKSRRVMSRALIPHIDPYSTDWPVLYLSAARLQFEIIVERNYDEVDSNFTIPGY